MVDERNSRDRETYVTRESHVERDTGRSGSTMAFVLGGLVVAVLVIAYFLFGGVTGGGTGTTITVEAPDGDGIVEDGGDGGVTGGGAETSVTVEAPDGGGVVEDGGNSGKDSGGTAQDGANVIDNGGDATADATIDEAN